MTAPRTIGPALELVSLQATGFRGWREGALALDRPLTIVVGENGSGKSSTLNAIEWCLFGREAERKSSGVPERTDWKVAHGERRIEVTLVCRWRGAPVSIARRRSPGARSEDELEVVREGAEPLEGARAAAWLAGEGFPDWTTWRRAFCQHQEVLRARLVEGADRSSILAALLGLDEHDRLRRRVQDVGAARIVKQLDEVQDELEGDLLALLRRPIEEVEEEERGLAALGLERAQLGPERAGEIAGELTARATKLAGELELELAPGATIPEHRSELDEPALLRWAESWPEEVRGTSDVARRLVGLHREQAQLAGRLERFDQAEERWRRSRDESAALQRERGEREGQERELARVRETRETAEREVRSENEHVALLTDARGHMRAAGETDRCPVCEARIPELVRRLDAEIEERRGERLRALDERLGSLREQEESNAQHLRELDEAERREADALAALRTESREFEGLLPASALEGGREVGDAAREHERSLRRTIEGLETTRGRLERELDEHRRGTERLRQLARWRAASQRAARRTEVTRSPSWAELQEGIDRAAGLAADLEALAALLRDVQARESAEREREVNRALAEGYGSILGEGSARELVVRVKQTAKGLGYELEDARGARVLSTWNQAALNAVSLALLFAQAGERAARGAPAFCLLDDPMQGLDEERQRGLARALARLAERVPVIVATTPGAFADELWRAGSAPRRRIVLGAWGEERGAHIEADEVGPEEGAPR